MNQSHPMTRLEVVDIETLEVVKTVPLDSQDPLKVQQMSDTLLRNLNTFQFFVRSAPSAAPVAVDAAAEPVVIPDGWKLVPESPTLEMLEAANVPRRLNWDSLSIWKAMIEASPATTPGD